MIHKSRDQRRKVEINNLTSAMWLRHKQTKLCSMPIWNPVSEYQPKAKAIAARQWFSNYQYLALCVCQLMKMDGGVGCWGGNVTVPVEQVYSVFTINIQIRPFL